MSKNEIGQLTLPFQDSQYWSKVVSILNEDIDSLAGLDDVISEFLSFDKEPRHCSFFSTYPQSPDVSCSRFDFSSFWQLGWPLIRQLALDLPSLFPGGAPPIFKMRSSWSSPSELGQVGVSLTRRQCASLLAHSFLGSLKRPDGVLPNDFRFTVVELFVGTAVSPNSAVTILNYFLQLAKQGIADDCLYFERRGFVKGSPPPWQWENNSKPLSAVKLVDGSLDDCPADVHVEFANAFIGGGVMTGDAAMEELLFLRKPELMIGMAVMNRMVDEEAIIIKGAKKYSEVEGYSQSFEFKGSTADTSSPSICAIDAVRGGGPALTERAMLRDMNKARLAFEGAQELATGHWGCGAFGNNHDLMFLKQWLAASEAGVHTIFYHDFDRKQSHSIFPLVRRLAHLNVGELWALLNEWTENLRKPHNMNEFCNRILKFSRKSGKYKV